MQMTDTDIHSCGYYCDRFACIVAQRDELRNKLFSDQAVKTYSGGKPNYTQPIEKKWVGLTDDEIYAVENEYLVNSRIPVGCGLYFAKDIEAKLKEKNSTTEKNIQTSDNND
jgi:hypothetical protein